MCNCTQNPSQKSLSEREIPLPMHVIDVVARDVSQAHIALEALIELLRSDREADQHGLAYLLSYIQSNLERSDELITPYLT